MAELRVRPLPATGATRPPARQSATGSTDISVDDLVTGLPHFRLAPCDISVPGAVWCRYLRDRDHHPPVAPAGAGQHPSQCRDGAQLPHRRGTRSSHLFEDAGFPLRLLTSGCTKGSPNGSGVSSALEERDRRPPQQNPDRTMDCVGSECGDKEYDATAIRAGCSSEYLAERYGDPTSEGRPRRRSLRWPGRKRSRTSCRPKGRRSASSSRTTRPTA